MKAEKYELYYREFTKYGEHKIFIKRFKTLKQAQERLKLLNAELKNKGFQNCEYMLVKVTRECLTD